LASFPPDIAFVEERLYPVRCPTFIFLQSDVLLNSELQIARFLRIVLQMEGAYSI